MKKNDYLEKLIGHFNNGVQLNDGAIRIIRAYCEAKREKSTELIFGNMDGFFEHELETAENIFLTAGIYSFTSYDSSTALMDSLHFFLDQGWDIQAVTRKTCFDPKQKGLRFTR